MASAWEAPVFKCPSLVATNTLATKQFYCVKLDTSNDNQVVIAATDGEPIFGVLQNKPGAGVEAEVTCIGVTKVIASEALTVGDLWGTDSSGKAKIVEATNTGADIGDTIMGIVIAGGSAANDIVTVSIAFGHGRRVEAA